MNKTILAVVLVALIISASAYGTYSYYYSSGSSSPSPTPTPTVTPSSSPTSAPTASPTPTAKPTTLPTQTPTVVPTAIPTPSPTPAPTSVTVTDGDGDNITIALPVTRIVSLNGGITEMLCAMGCQDLIIGRDKSSNLPPSVSRILTVGENAYQPNVEKIIELNPGVIFADSMLPYNTAAMEQLQGAGIPIYIADTTTPEPTNPSQLNATELYNLPTPIDFTCQMMQKLSVIVGHQDNVTAYSTWAQQYNKLVKDRIATLTPNQQVSVLLEWYQPYQTFVTQSVYQGGGVNIAENQTVYAPILSPEFVVEQNPSVIIRMISSPTKNINDFIAAKNEIIGRTAIQDVDAVKYGRVYVCDFDARSGIHAVVGYLYWAKWLQPSLFPDIDPATVNQELNQKFFGNSIAGTFAYP
jgi:iron complex transport system substrate-binding protein